MSPLTEPTKLILKKDSVAATDTNIREVSLLLHGNGANGSTIIDSSLNPKTVTAVGNAQISTAQSKFGGSSIAFDGAGDYVVIPSGDPFNFSSGDFTIEFFLYTASLSNFTGVLTKRADEASYSPFLFETDNSAQKRMRFLTSTTGASWITLTSSSALPLSQWVHVAVVRSGVTVTYYEDGVSKASSSISGSVISNAASVVLGRSAESIVGSAQLNGYIDELRITKGVARYTSNFTPPTAPFPDF